MNGQKAYRPGRCALCGKFENHSIHQNVPQPLTVWQKLARLAWPRWMWRTSGTDGTMPHSHKPDSKDRAIAASDSMSILRRRYGRK